MNKTENSKDIISEILDEIINKIVEQKQEQEQEHDPDQEQKTIFVEQIFKTVIQIISKSHNCTNVETLKKYEYYRYSNIIALLRTFIVKINNLNVIDNETKDRLYGYLGYIYIKTDYCKILKNIIYTFKLKHISVRDYSTPNICRIKNILREYINKHYACIGMLQNKELLCTINKELLDDLFCKIIFELTIYMTYFK